MLCLPVTGQGACAGRYERKGEWSNVGIYNYVLEYESLWGPKYQTGVPTGDFAQAYFCSTPSGSQGVWGEDLLESESAGQSVGECMSAWEYTSVLG